MFMSGGFMFKKLICTLLLITITICIFPVTSAAITPGPVVDASAAMLFELRRGQVLYSKTPMSRYILLQHQSYDGLYCH